MAYAIIGSKFMLLPSLHAYCVLHTYVTVLFTVYEHVLLIKINNHAH